MSNPSTGSGLQALAVIPPCLNVCGRLLLTLLLLNVVDVEVLLILVLLRSDCRMCLLDTNVQCNATDHVSALGMF